MKIEDLLKDQIRNLDLNNPHHSILVKQLLEYWASLKDNDINNRLLQDLIFKYSTAEKKLVQLNQELIEKQKHLDEDLKAAAEIQTSLLPKQTVVFGNLEICWKFEPCEHMGGDIFNIIQLDSDHMAIYMLDVSGHGVPAAMITVSVSQFLQKNSNNLLKNDGKSSLILPDEVLNALDTEFPFERFNNFFTITYIIINTKNGEAIYSNAGHPYPILLRKSGAIELLKKGGPSIGLGEFDFLTEDKDRFKKGQLQINPGDKLFIYTDGIVEYQNYNEEFYGDDRFFKKLKELKSESVHNIVERSINALMEFGNNAKPQDDITLLGLEIKE